MHVPRKIQPALTGTSTRMKVLPHVSLSSIENYSTEPQKMIPLDDNKMRTLIQADASKEPLIRKCIYTYEDKYEFVRIITGDSFVFDSHFESGNLHSAFRVLSQQEAMMSGTCFWKHTYDLYMHNDLYTTGNTQWFYFRVSNTRQGQEATFHLKNFQKPGSLFNEGMRPLMYSTKSGRGWERFGKDIRYYPASALSKGGTEGNLVGEQNSSRAGQEMYCLAFSHTFEHNDDVCYIAYSLPYTYTDLQRFLFKIQSHPQRSRYIRRKLLCHSIAGNLCDVLTITAKSASPEILNQRVVVIISSRVHPGETNSSWIAQGIIQHLTGESREAQELREKFIFKIIPMLNPDGVINGNYRTSLSGMDLNRRWSTPDPVKHPTIYHAKELIRAMKKLRTVGLILDIHGHSRKQGLFVYGCVPDKKMLGPISLPIVPGADGPQSALMGPSKPVHVSGQLGFGSAESDFRGQRSLKAVSDSNVAPNKPSSHSSHSGIAQPAAGDGLQIVGIHSTAFSRNSSNATSSAPSPAKPPPSSMPGNSNAIMELAEAGDVSANAVMSNLKPCLPPKGCCGRDVVSWRVRLLPRIFDAFTPAFSMESCRYVTVIASNFERLG